MKTYDIDHLPSIIHIGYDGENNWRPQAFVCTSLLANHPSGIITLWLLPKGEEQAFPVALVRDGNTVVWTPTSGELTAEIGSMQFVCVDGEDVGKSPVTHYCVDGSILPGADHPEEVPSWATQTVERAESAANRAEEAAESIDLEQIEQTIQDAVEAYLEEHPITVTETDPTVPAWAKQPTKPTYTAQEVGALPSSYTPPVTSVNGMTGDVVVETGGGGAVDSVNGKTGAVVLDASDVGAYVKPSGGIPASDLAAGVIPTVPTKVSDLTNDSEFQTAPFEIPINTDEQDNYSTTASAEEIFDNADNCIINFMGIHIAPMTVTKYEQEVDISFTHGMIQYGMLASQTISVQADKSNNNVNVNVEFSAADLLPNVTESDNGKILSVVNGAWAAKTDESSSVPFIIPITKDGDNWTTTASAADIIANAGNCVLSYNGTIFSESGWSTLSYGTAITFSYPVATTKGSIRTETFVIFVPTNGESSIIRFESEVNPLPAVTASDNGKFLRVVSGAWAAQAVPAAESASFGGGS